MSEYMVGDMGELEIRIGVSSEKGFELNALSYSST